MKSHTDMGQRQGQHTHVPRQDGVAGDGLEGRPRWGQLLGPPLQTHFLLGHTCCRVRTGLGHRVGQTDSLSLGLVISFALPMGVTPSALSFWGCLLGPCVPRRRWSCRHGPRVPGQQRQHAVSGPSLVRVSVSLCDLQVT